MKIPRSIRVQGPLAECASNVWSGLRSEGYTRLSSLALLKLLNHLSKWLEVAGLIAWQLTQDKLEAYLRHRQRVGYRSFRTRASIEPVYRVLVRGGLVPAPQDATRLAHPTPLERLVGEYRDYLVRERGLAPETVKRYLLMGSRSLPALCGSDLNLRQICGESVIRLVLQESRTRPGERTIFTTCLRSLLRFLHVRGQIPSDLSTAVPAVARWRLSSLPRFLEPTQVKALLDSCDRRTTLGRRAHAVLLLLSRLGLRAGEVRALDLDDVRWHEGEIVIRGKGLRQDRLPLPADVGDALARYVRQGRRRSKDRALFLTHCAPHRRLSRVGVTEIVYAACRRSEQPLASAHRLRHTAATDMLRAGASLHEIGQVLRHRHDDSTAIYAKVDRDRLRELARPWAGGAQ